MYPPRSTNRPGWRALGLALAAAALVAGCGDGETSTNQITPPEAPSQTHLGDGFHWNLIASPVLDVALVNGAQWEFPVPFNVGTGRINPFLRVQRDPQEDGFNTDGARTYDQKNDPFTHSLLLSGIPVIEATIGGVTQPAREIIFDANESNSDAIAAQFAINEFDLYECIDNAAAADYTTRAQLAACDKIYEINDGTSETGRAKATDAATSGSGNALDYRILIPNSFFEEDPDCEYAPDGVTDCDTYIILDVDLGDESNTDWKTSSTFEEFSTIRRPQVNVEKTAEVTFTRTYNWIVTKEADIDSHALLPGETGETEYTITADLDDPPFTDSNHMLSGEITISNTSGETAQIDAIRDELPNAGGTLTPGAGLTCTENGSPVNSFPYDLDDGDTIVCTYSTGAAADVGDINTAVVEISDPEDQSTSLPDAEATAEVTAGTITTVHASVDVYDDYQGSDDPDASPVFLGTASISDPPPTAFTRTRQWTYGDVVCALGEVDNTGIITEAGNASNVLGTDDETVTILCADIEVTKTAATSLTRTWNWSITKSADPATWDLFDGDEGTSEWTVDVDKVDFDDSEWNVSGVITVENTGDFAVTIASVTDEVNGSIAATVDNCSIALPALLAAGASMTCDYSADLPNGNAGSNVASATIDGDGTIDSDPVNFDFDPADVVTEVYDEVNVTDTNGMSWGPISDDQTFTYEETFECGGDEGQHDNTATITETGDSDDASVTVNCYDLTVTKDAETSFTRTWTWDILKELDTQFFLEGTYDEIEETATIQEGELLTVRWTLTLTALSEDSDHAVDGEITVHNNHPSMAATINSVDDVVSPDIAATVDCGVTFPYDLAAGGDLVCDYSADLPDESSRTNTATAEQQNYAYDKDLNPTDNGTTDYSNSPAVDVIFSSTPTSEIDECVAVTDVLEQEGVEVGSQDLGNYCASDGLPKEYTVDFEFGGEGIPVECGDNPFDNTGHIVTNDTGTPDESTSSTNIFVACEIGCTLTQGYWKTHNDSFWGGAPTDVRWEDIGDFDGDLTAEGEEEGFFYSGDTWFGVFWTAPKGNVYYNLAHQWMAAYLNVNVGGASAPTEVQDALDDAMAWFDNPAHTPAYAKGLKGNDEERAMLIEWAGILGSFNEGEIGPGHCTENEEPEV